MSDHHLEYVRAIREHVEEHELRADPGVIHQVDQAIAQVKELLAMRGLDPNDPTVHATLATVAAIRNDLWRIAQDEHLEDAPDCTLGLACEEVGYFYLMHHEGFMNNVMALVTESPLLAT